MKLRWLMLMETMGRGEAWIVNALLCDMRKYAYHNLDLGCMCNISQYHKKVSIRSLGILDNQHTALIRFRLPAYPF